VTDRPDPDAILDLLPDETVQAMASMVKLEPDAIDQTIQLFGWGSRAVLADAGAIEETGSHGMIRALPPFGPLVSAAADREDEVVTDWRIQTSGGAWRPC